MNIGVNLKELCSKFSFKGDFVEAVPYGDGHINDTYKVAYINDDSETRYILQRVNHLIFKNVEGLMSNIERVTAYLNDAISENDKESGYEILTLISTLKDGSSYHKDNEGNFWRAYVFVENATGHTFAEDISMLYEAGKAFGRFQSLLNGFPASTLNETIIGFHNTPQRYRNLLSSIEDNAMGLKDGCAEEIKFVTDRESLVNVITDALTSSEIPLRVTHNDTKINNVLLDDETGIGRCVIDLDTVMPGSALYDFGDAIRSCGSTLVEDSENLDELKVDYERFEAYTKGFIETCGDNLNEKEIELLPISAIIMTFECGIRFLEDYLNGDNYFKVHKEGHNLIRAKNQFRFVLEMEHNIDKLHEIVKKCCKEV